MRNEKDSVGTSRVWLLTLALAIALATMRVHAHVGDVVYPFTEITDEMLEMMDLTDGSIEDWETVMGEPTLNLLGFTRLEYVPREGGGVTLALASRDPGDWDVRVWLGWHRGTGRLYFGAQVSDDRFVGGYEGEKINRCGYDCVGLYIDGDHSGGAARPTRDYEQVQSYSAVAEAPAGLHVGLGAYDGADWMDRLPYAEGSGSARGENPTVWVVEFAVTPFDLLLGDDPEASLASNLRPEMIVGFNIGVNDLDTEPEDWGEFYNLFWPTDFTPNGFGDGLLLPAGDDTGDGSVVESVSWARIKASLEITRTPSQW